MDLSKITMGIDKLEITGKFSTEFSTILNTVMLCQHKEDFQEKILFMDYDYSRFPTKLDRSFSSKQYSQVHLFDRFILMAGNHFQKTDKIVVNPNKEPDIMHFLLSLMHMKLITRIDVNFDVEIDIQEVFEKIKRKRIRKFQVYYNCGVPETFYIGGKGTGRMLRIYDKYIESKKEEKYKGITRIEFQIRSGFLRKHISTVFETCLLEVGNFLDYCITESNEDGGQLSSDIIEENDFSDIYYDNIHRICSTWF